MDDFTRKLPIPFLLLLAACSSTHLRKFDEGDLSKEVSADAGKKFEVKDVEGVPAAPQTEAPKIVVKKVHPHQLKKKKEVLAMAEASPTPVLLASRRIEPIPFEVGEKLFYDIRYVGVTAGYFSLEALPVKQMAERKVYHFEANIKTVKIFELVYRVNDLVSSYWDYDGLYSHRFTMDLDESKQTRKLIELYDYDKKKSFYWNRVDHVDKGLREEKQSYDIPLWSQDPISALYYLRTAALPKETGPEFRFPLILDGKPWEGVLHFKKKESIYAGGKDRMANVYQFDNFQNGELKNKNNTIWVSDDEKRYILRVEAKVKIGTFAVALDKVQ